MVVADDGLVGDGDTDHGGFLSVVDVGLPDDMDSITHHVEGCKVLRCGRLVIQISNF